MIKSFLQKINEGRLNKLAAMGFNVASLRVMNDSGNLGSIVFVAIFALVLLAVGGYMMYMVTNVTAIPATSAYSAPVEGLATIFGNTTTVAGLFIVIVLIAGALAYFAGVFNQGTAR